MAAPLRMRRAAAAAALVAVGACTAADAPSTRLATDPSASVVDTGTTSSARADPTLDAPEGYQLVIDIDQLGAGRWIPTSIGSKPVPPAADGKGLHWVFYAVNDTVSIRGSDGCNRFEERFIRAPDGFHSLERVDGSTTEVDCGPGRPSGLLAEGGAIMIDHDGNSLLVVNSAFGGDIALVRE